MTKPSLRSSAGRLQVLADRAGRAAQLAYFAVFDGTRGRGRPRPVENWDAQWRDGEWDYLVSEDELPRYAVVAGYVRTMNSTSTLLDVGCGHGQLLALLGEGAIGAYHGIDVSSEAVRRAQESAPAFATFEVADLTQWVATERYDVVVMNEVLYYVADTVTEVRRYLERVRPGGVMIVSMFRHGNTRLIWRRLAQNFPVLDACEVRNRLGEVVDIKLLRSPVLSFSTQ